MLTVIVAGRNDDYGKNFRERVFRTALHNTTLFRRFGIDFEYFLAEWNPLPDRPPLSEEFVRLVPHGRAIIIPPKIHSRYSLNPEMSFHEMAAKNAALRRARGSDVVLTNADILFSEEIVRKIARGNWDANTLYRAHRIDVRPELSWDEIQNPLNQLPSGEGLLPPSYYLGAGGDFCLAKRGLWHSLRGFDERTRFSTRAKDWQLFLSAATQGVNIEFIGDVYHLDHQGGFRNTAPNDLKSGRVHFGQWWDIEFGTPVTNFEDWGFHGIREEPHRNDSRIIKLDARGYAVSRKRNQIDRTVRQWITHPAGSPDTAAAALLHSICSAHRERKRLICRIEHPRFAATLAGFAAVAESFGVEIFSNWRWPKVTGYKLYQFTPQPRSVRHDDWVLEETSGVVQVHEHGTGQLVNILPTKVRVDAPEFNPFLGRRLLRAYLEFHDKSRKRIAIYGAGLHTRSLLQWGIPDELSVVAIVETNTRAKTFAGNPLRPLRTLSPQDVEAILLSSTSFESDMAEQCRQYGFPNVMALYADWSAVAETTASIQLR